MFVRYVEGIAYTHTESVCMCRRMYGRQSDESDTRDTARARGDYLVHTDSFLSQKTFHSSTKYGTTGSQCALVPMTN